jgi:hypothetical protein
VGRGLFYAYSSSRYSNGLLPYVLAEPLERPQRLGVGHLGVDIHRYVDLSVTEYPHGHPGMNVERGEQGGARMPGVVDGDTTDPARAQRVPKRRLKLRGSYAVPARVMNTSPVSGHWLAANRAAS